MSGHSHFATIKHKKGAADAARSKIFSKLAREITVAAKEGGEDPETNSRLRTVMEKARSLNMPADNIERAIKKGAGAEEGAALEEILLEGYGPGGIALLIQGITDNKNRTLGEIKQILTRHQGKLVEGGAVRWMFEQKGVLVLRPETMSKEDLELAAIEAGAQDTSWTPEGLLEIYTDPSRIEEAKKSLEQKGIALESSGLQWVPKEPASTEQKVRNAAEKLFEELAENDSVQNIYSNLA